MLNGKKIVVVLPAYNAARTLEKTYNEIPFDIVDDVILVDDASKDDTSELGRKIGIKHIIKHQQNKGYGGNQKTCYQHALALQADIIIMLHPDYQYTPKLLMAMSSIIAFDVYPVVFGSRILGMGVVFDNEITAQIFMKGFEIAEVTCPTKYFPEASSINFKRSSIYGLGVLRTSILYRLHKWGIGSFRIFKN